MRRGEPGSLFERAMRAREERHERALAAMGQPLHRELLRAAFLSGALLADFLLPPTAYQAAGPWGSAAFAALLAALVALEAWGYWRVWGPRGAWAPARAGEAASEAAVEDDAPLPPPG